MQSGYKIVIEGDPRNFEKLAALVKNEGFKIIDATNESATDRKLTAIFNALGLSSSLSGTVYLREAVKIEIRERNKGKLKMKALYPEIAALYNSSPIKVERAIRHAIGVFWNRGRIENFNCVFGKNVFSKYAKPTNSELIALLADKICFE